MKLKLLPLALLLLIGCSDTPQPLEELNLTEKAAKSFGSPLLLSYGSCEQLAAELKKTKLDEMHTRFAIHLKNPPSDMVGIAMPGAAGAMPTAAPEVAADKAGVEGVDYSGTNNQEKNIDEDDIIKTDGKYFYILNKSTVEILNMPDIGTLEHASTIKLDTPGSGLLIRGDQAFVLAREQEQNTETEMAKIMPAFMNSNLRLDVIDLSTDRKTPTVRDSYYFQGDFISARKIGNRIYAATYSNTTIPGVIDYPELPDNYYLASKADQAAMWVDAVNNTVAKNQAIINSFDFLSLLPNSLQKSGTGFDRQKIAQSDCTNTFGMSDGSSNGFMSLISLDPQADQTIINIERVRGKRPLVYASADQLILASSEHEPWWFFNNEELKDQSTIHRFDLKDDAPPSYHDSVRIPGTLNNSFSLSEYEGYLRVATTTSPQQRFWQPNQISQDENHLFVLGDDNGRLDIIASIEGLAAGEKIWSTRFSKDKGFLVTFKQVDPLFTLDLSDPKDPQVAGELKVPGVSTYLQDIGQDQLLAVGYGSNYRGDGLDFKTSISLFDISNFAEPKLADTLSFAAAEGLNNSWSTVSSEANRSHLAVNYFAPVAMTAIPINTDRFIQNPLDPSGGQYEYISKLTLVNTKAGEKLSIHGEVDHSEFYNKNSSSEYRPPEIRRSYFVGDYIYAISPKAITATRLTDMTKTARYELP